MLVIDPLDRHALVVRERDGVDFTVHGFDAVLDIDGDEVAVLDSGRHGVALSEGKFFFRAT